MIRMFFMFTGFYCGAIAVVGCWQLSDYFRDPKSTRRPGLIGFAITNWLSSAVLIAWTLYWFR